MLILISQLINQSVVSFDDAEHLGILREPIIDPDNGRLLGYFVGYGLMFMKQGVIPVDDVVGYDEQRIIVQASSTIHSLDDEPKLKKIVKQKIPVFGAKVITETDKYLGRANDLLLDTELHMIVRYYVHGLMSDRIIAAEHVQRIEKRGIIVTDTAPAATNAVGAEAEPT